MEFVREVDGGGELRINADSMIGGGNSGFGLGAWS